MELTSRSHSDMSLTYQRKTKIRTKYILLLQILTDKSIDSDLEALAKLRRDYPSNHRTGYSNINSIRNKIVQLTDICKTSPIEILCIDETKLDSSFPNAQVNHPDYQFLSFRRTEIHQEEKKYFIFLTG